MANHCSPTSLPLFCNSHSTQPHWFLYFSSNMSSMDPLHYIYPVPIILRVAMCDHAVQTHKLFPFICLQFSHSVVSSSLLPHGLQLGRLPCPSPTLEAYSNSCPSSWWCHPTISSSVSLQSFPASGPFPMSEFFTSGGQSIGASASASVLPMNIQDLFPLGIKDN